MSKRTKAGRSVSLRRWAMAARRNITMPGRVVLLGGEANCGKSTVLRRVAHEAAIRGEVVIYVSGEDGGLDLRRRFREDGLDPSRVSLLDLRAWNDVSGAILDLKPDLVVVDAVQTIPYDAEFGAGTPETLAAIFRGIETIAHSEWKTGFVVSMSIGKREGMSGPISRVGMGRGVDALMVLSRCDDVLHLMPLRDCNGPPAHHDGQVAIVARSRRGGPRYPAPETHEVAHAEAHHPALREHPCVGVVRWSRGDRARVALQARRGGRGGAVTLQGRKTPPSDDELRAAGEAGAMWVGTRPVVRNLMGAERPCMTAVLSSSPGYAMGLHYDDDRPATRWFYIEPDGTMSNGPVVWPDATFGAACVRLWNDPKSLDALRDVQLAAEGRLGGAVRASAGTRPSDAFVEARTAYWLCR